MQYRACKQQYVLQSKNLLRGRQHVNYSYYNVYIYIHFFFKTCLTLTYSLLDTRVKTIYYLWTLGEIFYLSGPPFLYLLNGAIIAPTSEGYNENEKTPVLEMKAMR